MTIEYLGGDTTEHVLVTMDAAELDGCGVSFTAMSLEDAPTRALLRRLLSMVTRMGLRREGERVRVDCTGTGSGGCVLLISRVTEQEYFFDSSDDIISAYKAGVLPEGQLTREDEGWRLRFAEPLSGGGLRILSEYGTPCGEGNQPDM